MSETLAQRNKLLKIYNESLQFVKGDICVQNYLQTHLGKLQLEQTDNIAILAIGKAAASMAQGAYRVLKDNIIHGLVVTKDDHVLGNALLPGFDYIESSHPIPTDKSLTAGEAVIKFIQGLPAQTHLLVLISGGASALVEKLNPVVSLKNMIQANDWLLSSGLEIDDVNRIRQQLSMIKGGKLASYAKHLNVTNLLLSDVLSNDPACIGSGLFVPALKQNRNIYLPDWLKALLSQCDNPDVESELKNTVVFTDLVATNRILLNKISAQCLSDTGPRVFDAHPPLSGQVEVEAEKIALQLKQGESGFYLWGGEPTVKLSGRVGKGGRNQHLALLIAEKIKGIQNMVVLCIGTDGSDGNTVDAGALVDGETITRGEQAGLVAKDSITGFNAGEFLQASGDVINTGPTGTNVMDVVIAHKWE